jgi:ribosome-associated protein
MDIADGITIPDEELEFTFARAGGPGGQNVNKVASKAVLHWDVGGNTSLPPGVKERLRAHQRGRINAEGRLVLHGQRFRDQAKNVEDCRERLREIVLQALRAPRPRRATKPTRGARERRLAAKRQQSSRKAARRRPTVEE